MAQLFTVQRRTLYALQLMSLSLREISVQLKRFGLGITLYMVSMSMTYFDPNKHPNHSSVAIPSDASAQDHSQKLSKFMFASEALPFDSPEILHRYHKEMAHNKKPSQINMHMIKASRKWFPLIEPILEKYGIPEDFKYVAAAESKFVYATSIKGAQGFWQFMPHTARELGLEVNEEVDERYNVVRSTEVACKFFKQNHKVFGNWSSVVLAYNMGTVGLLRKIRKAENTDNIHFVKTNRETEKYFFRVLATRDLLTHPSKYGYKVNSSSNVANVTTIHVKESIADLKEFCKEKKISLYTLKNYNPWLRGNALTVKEETGFRPYTLIIPILREDASEIVLDIPEKNIEVTDSTSAL